MQNEPQQPFLVELGLLTTTAQCVILTGVTSEGVDTALLISHSRRSIRRSVLKRGVINVLSFRQFLFSTQASRARAHRRRQWHAKNA